MNEVEKNEEYIALSEFVSEFQKELLKDKQDINKINEMYSILKNKIKQYYSLNENKLTLEDKELLETIITEVILKLPNELENESYEELINLTLAPYTESVHIAIRLQMLVQRLSMNGVTSENCKRILDKISDIQYVTSEDFSREKFDWCIFMLKSNFVMELPIEILEENVEWLVDIYAGNGYRDFSIRLFKELSVEKIDKIIDKIAIPFSIEDIDIFKRYFEYLLSNSENAIINNNFAAQIFGFVNPLLEDERLVEFKRIIEREKSKYQYPDMSKYSRFIPQDYSQEVEKMDQTTFDEFCKDLEKLKILDGIIPEEYCDFLISQKIDGTSILNEDLDKYFSILKRAFEDKARYVLKKDNITNYAIFFSNNELEYLKNDSEAHLEYGCKRIVFEEKNLQNLNDSNFNIINHMFHECRHAWQFELFYEEDLSKIDGNIYNMIKEFIIGIEDRAFYKTNYYRIYCEIDARSAGAIGQAEYLTYLGVNPTQMIENIGYRPLPLEKCSEAIKFITQSEFRWASDKVGFDGNIISINDILRKVIKEKTELVEEFPALKLEFDKNGERKATVDIFNAAIENQADSNINDIYTKIFECRNTVALSSAIQTLDSILEVLKNNENLSETSIIYINLILENEILNSLLQANREEEQFNVLVQKLKGFVEANINVKSFDGINRKLKEFFKNGDIEYGYLKDDVLKDTAIKHILSRPISSVEEFRNIIEDLSKITLFEYFNAKSLLMKTPLEIRQEAFKVLGEYFDSEIMEIIERTVILTSEEKEKREKEMDALQDISNEVTHEDKTNGKKVILWFADKIKFVKNGIKKIFNSDYENR